MTGSDRDEPHCPPGFVDRAYLVFCVELRTTSASTDYPDLPTRVPLTPFEVSSPIPSAVVGYEPQVIHHTHKVVRCRWRGATQATSSADGGADSRLGRLCRSPLSPGEAGPATSQAPQGLHPVSVAGTSHGTCQRARNPKLSAGTSSQSLVFQRSRAIGAEPGVGIPPDALTLPVTARGNSSRPTELDLSSCSACEKRGLFRICYGVTPQKRRTGRARGAQPVSRFRPTPPRPAGRRSEAGQS